MIAMVTQNAKTSLGLSIARACQDTKGMERVHVMVSLTYRCILIINGILL